MHTAIKLSNNYIALGAQLLAVASLSMLIYQKIAPYAHLSPIRMPRLITDGVDENQMRNMGARATVSVNKLFGK